MTLYGIANCNTVKKARAWLEARCIPYVFHDFRKDGIDEAWLARVVAHAGWEALLNRRGTTWRQLADAERAAVHDAPSAIRLMLARPSVIKRPVVEHAGGFEIGFDEQRYQALFGT